MDKFVKIGLELGVGLAFITVEALTNALDKLEKEGKLDKKDGDKMLKAVVAEYQAEGKKYADNLKSQIDALLKANPLAMKNDMNEMDVRIKKDIKNLSARLNKISKNQKGGSKHQKRSRK